MSSKIFRSFKSLNLDGNSIDFRIKFIEPKFYEHAILIMEKNFITDEPMFRARKVIKDPVKTETTLKFWRNILESEKISIGCFKIEDGTETLVGVNILGLKKKNDVKTTILHSEDIVKTINMVKNHLDVFEHYQVDEFLYAYGLAVDSKYRGRGIALEILKTRADVLNRLKLKVSMTLFTGLMSQKAAAKAGFEENFAITYKKIYEINKKLYYEGLENEYIKITSLLIN